MEANLITAMAGVLGSVSGASAAIATTWISQKSQTIRERGKWETRKRETLYGDFITEASRLVADALDHSLDKPETLVNLYALLGRIRLVSSDAVLAAAQECINPDLERWYGRRAGSHIVELPSASHSVYVSRPKEVAALIEQAATHAK